MFFIKKTKATAKTVTVYDFSGVLGKNIVFTIPLLMIAKCGKDRFSKIGMG